VRRDLLLEAALLGCFVLLVTTWFTARPASVPPLVPFAGLLVLGGIRGRPSWRTVLRAPAPETLAALGAAMMYRAPALVHPWAWVNRDGAYPAFVALHLMQGMRPAPIFTEGAHYQGTLKGHLGALLGLVTGVRDLSLLMVLSSLLLYLVFIAATMALVRRLAGRGAALVAGLYLAISPRFLTVFSLNCVGQYVDVLALGGLAVVLLAGLLAGDRRGAEARGSYLATGLLLGAAFWQQPIALAYIGAALVALALRRATWRDAWSLLLPLGVFIGALPVLLWNVENHWQSGDIMGREPGELAAQADALLHLIRRTLTVSFATLSGLSPGHPWGHLWPVAAVGYLLVPGAFAFYLAVRGREIAGSMRAGRPSPALLPPLLLACCLAQWWAVAAGRIYWRPRYLLPVTAATAMHLGVVVTWLWPRARVLGALIVGALLAVNVSGTWPRLRSGAEVAAPYERLVRSLEAKQIRTGYADFSISAPVTMFTGERIVFSSRLGPTASYESDRHTQKVAREGPDAYVLRADDDPERFAAVLRSLGVSYKLDVDPFPIFYGFSRRVRLDEVAGFRGEEEAEPSPGES
jgi:4-amino-4-deoxy-L-arabinose transferase-like glycosyltransferase